MGFPRQKYWSGLPFPSPEDLPRDSGIEPAAPAWQADSLPLSHLGSPMRTCNGGNYLVKGDWEGGFLEEVFQQIAHIMCRAAFLPWWLSSEENKLLHSQRPHSGGEDGQWPHTVCGRMVATYRVGEDGRWRNLGEEECWGGSSFILGILNLRCWLDV